MSLWWPHTKVWPSLRPIISCHPCKSNYSDVTIWDHYWWQWSHLISLKSPMKPSYCRKIAFFIAIWPWSLDAFGPTDEFFIEGNIASRNGTFLAEDWLEKCFSIYILYILFIVVTIIWIGRDSCISPIFLILEAAACFGAYVIYKKYVSS